MRVRLEEQEGSLVVTVTDTGIGLDPAFLELEVTVLFPSALENVITPANADRIRCKISCELANGPTLTYAAWKLTVNRSVLNELDAYTDYERRLAAIASASGVAELRWRDDGSAMGGPQNGLTVTSTTMAMNSSTVTSLKTRYQRWLRRLRSCSKSASSRQQTN